MRRKYFGDRTYPVDELIDLLHEHANRTWKQVVEVERRLRASGIKEIPGRVMIDHAAICRWNRPFGLRTGNRVWAGLRMSICREERTLREIKSGLRQPWSGLRKTLARKRESVG